MVRVNVINPKYLADQHLVAEYYEIIMLVSYVRKHPCLEGIPPRYCLGTGHIKFFKNKLNYLKKRHEEIKKEMKRRGFAARMTLNLKGLGKAHKNDWKACKRDEAVIKKRIKWKIGLKPLFYRYYGKREGKKFLTELLCSNKL